MAAHAQLAFKILQGSAETVFRRGGKGDFAAYLFRKLCTKFQQNRPSFVEDITRYIWSLFSGQSVATASDCSAEFHAVDTAAQNSRLALSHLGLYDRTRTLRRSMEPKTTSAIGCLTAVRIACTRGVQKVRRPTQLTTTYGHHILSLFDIFSYN